MEKPMVTIGIPTYNRADGFLKDTLESALEQSYPHLEIIVSDNCSTDATEDLIDNYDDQRLRYIRHDKNIGANNNFNYCLNKAKGDYFLLLHSDDLIDKDFVQACMDQAEAGTNLGIIQTGVRVVNANGEKLHECQNRTGGLPAGDFFLAWFNDSVSWYFCNTLFNTRLLKGLGGLHSQHDLIQDNVAIVKLASKYDRGNVKSVKASFRKHLNQRTYAANIKDWCDDYLTLVELMCSAVDGDTRRLRDRAMRVLCKRNLNRASVINSYTERLLAYLLVSRKFNFKYPLSTYLYENEFHRIMKKIGKGVQSKN